MKFAEPPRRVSEALPLFTGREWVLPPVLVWLEQSSERVMRITGEPGTGKSLLAAWMAGLGAAATTNTPELMRFRAALKAVHFCVAKGGNSPRAFAQGMAEQLTANVPGFGDALAGTLRESVNIRVEQKIATATGNVTGVSIERLEISGLSDEQSFDRVLREPIHALYKSGFSDPILLLVDALDESLTYTGTALDQLLARLDDWPAPVRVLITTRPHPRVLYQFQDGPRLDLIHDAPPGCDDVREYVGRALAGVAEPQRAELIERVVGAADGIFLYARLAVEDWLRPGLSVVRPAGALPKGLAGLYHEFFNRDYSGANRARWFDEAAPVLGLIAVGRGRGLSRAQLSALCGRSVQPTLESLRPYLDGELPDGPFRPFHKSLADFLLESSENQAYRLDPAAPHLQLANHYLAMKNGAAAWTRWDDYGLRHVPSHLAEGVRNQQPDQRDADVERLVRLVSDDGFRKRQAQQTKDPGWHQRDFEKAVYCASTNLGPGGPILLIEAALALVAARKELLQPSELFQLARQGRLPDAERHLALFAPDRFWRDTVLHAITWAATPAHREAARALRSRLVPESGSNTIGRLTARLDAALAGQPAPGPFCQGAPDLRYVTQILQRLGGGLDAQKGIEPLAMSGLGPNDDDAVEDYLAEQDGPPLVAFAAVDPINNTRPLLEYIELHAGNPYVFYRNRSLAALVTATLDHPDQEWVRGILEKLCSCALAGGGADFRRGAKLACLARRVVGGDAPARTEFLDGLNALRGQAHNVNPERGQGDSWSHLLRELAVQAELHGTLLDLRGEVGSILDQAFELPFGFAGYRSRACIQLAESIRVVEPQNVARQEQALEAALRAAHNVQDYRFSLQETSRVIALRRRWWNATPANWNLSALVREFVDQPDAPRFSAVHVVERGFGLRESGPFKLEVPDHAYEPRTLNGLARLYACPVAELMRLNRAGKWAGDDGLPDGAEINIPDARMPALLAARFAAEVLAAPNLSTPERLEWLQALVPVAVTDPTALDTVLMRLMIAAEGLPLSAWQALHETIERLIPDDDELSNGSPNAALRAEM